MEIARGPGRDPFRQREIISFIQNKIISGTWQSGDRIMTRVELESKFEASSLTVQRALKKLIDGGFLEAQGRKGTFVAENLPHVCNIALVLPRDISSTSLFMLAIQKQALEVNERINMRFIPFYVSFNNTLCDDYVKLVKAIESNELAGIFFATRPFPFENTPVLDNKLPKVTVSSEPFKGVKTIGMESFNQLALDYFVEKKCKKLAVICSSNREEFIDNIRNSFNASIELDPNLVLQLNTDMGQVAKQWVKLMMDLPKSKRPDALFVSNDNLTPMVLEGLEEAGIRLEKDVQLVTHSNFPLSKDIPNVKKIGYNVEALIHHVTELIENENEEPVPLKAIEQKDFLSKQ